MKCTKCNKLLLSLYYRTNLVKQKKRSWQKTPKAKICTNCNKIYKTYSPNNW